MRRFKSVPLDAAVTGPEELVQLKVVIASLISPINFSECTKEWEHNRRNALTLHRLNSFSHLLTTDVCVLSLYFNSSSQLSTPHALTSDFPLSFKNVFVFYFCPQSKDSQIIFSYGQFVRNDNCNMDNSLFRSWFNRFIVDRCGKIIPRHFNSPYILLKEI